MHLVSKRSEPRQSNSRATGLLMVLLSLLFKKEDEDWQNQYKFQPDKAKYIWRQKENKREAD